MSKRTEILVTIDEKDNGLMIDVGDRSGSVNDLSVLWVKGTGIQCREVIGDAVLTFWRCRPDIQGHDPRAGEA